MQKIIQKIRNILPLSLRQKIGPYVAYVVYFFKVYVLVNRKRPHVLSLDETLNVIKKENLSVIRFGDGEMSSIASHDLPFQKKDSQMAEKLLSVLKSDHKGLLICIPGIFEKLSHFTKTSFWFTLHHLFKYGHLWNEYLHHKKTYGDAFITRPYLTYKDKSHSVQIFNKMISLWEEKDVVLIEGSKSRLGLGNDLFGKVKSLGRILCPPENAYSKYNEIRNEILKVSKDKLILLSVGPTAKILAYDLFLLGYRVLDIGHIDMEYEMFLRKENGLVKVKYK
ncbi:MAG: GT-D fold domain-containing glycosyltransferase, partial [Chryseobacterium sp.]